MVFTEITSMPLLSFRAGTVLWGSEGTVGSGSRDCVPRVSEPCALRSPLVYKGWAVPQQARGVGGLVTASDSAQVCAMKVGGLVCVFLTALGTEVTFG